MSVNVTVQNQTTNYTFRVEPQHDEAIVPGKEMVVSLDDHETQVLTFDRTTSPSPWKAYGLGTGGLAYSIDPASGQSNFSIMMGPAAAGPQSTPAPTFTASGAVSGTRQDDWSRGINLVMPGSDESDIFVTITEQT